MKEEKKEKMLNHLCKLIAWYNETENPEYYHYYQGYILALTDFGIFVDVIRNEYVICDGKMYKIEVS